MSKQWGKGKWNIKTPGWRSALWPCRWHHGKHWRAAVIANVENFSTQNICPVSALGKVLPPARKPVKSSLILLNFFNNLSLYCPHFNDTAIQFFFSLEITTLSGTTDTSMESCRSHAFRDWLVFRTENGDQSMAQNGSIICFTGVYRSYLT